MNNPISWLKKLLIGCTILGMVFCALVSFGFLVGMAKDRSYRRGHLQPGVDFVRQFQSAYGRLPSQEEFRQWNATRRKFADVRLTTAASPEAASLDSVFQEKGGRKPDDFCLSVWRGECWEYYFSWKDGFETVF